MTTRCSHRSSPPSARPPRTWGWRSPTSGPLTTRPVWTASSSSVDPGGTCRCSRRGPPSRARSGAASRCRPADQSDRCSQAPCSPVARPPVVSPRVSVVGSGRRRSAGRRRDGVPASSPIASYGRTWQNSPGPRPGVPAWSSRATTGPPSWLATGCGPGSCPSATTRHSRGRSRRPTRSRATSPS